MSVFPAQPQANARGARLVADIGGSNARFGWLAPDSDTVEHVQQLPVTGHAELADAARHYLDEVRQARGADYNPPHAAALAVATAVQGDAVNFTNSPWAFSRRSLQAALHLDRLVVLNDFEALALALPHLGAHQVQAWPGAVLAPTLPEERAAMAVIGPGTGLGVAAVVPTAHGWVAVPGEGGHSTMPAGDDFEAAVLACVRQRHAHVSAERVLSGIGLPELYAAICTVQGHSVAPGAATLAKPALPPALPGAPEIVEGGLAGDALMRQTLDVFCALLGSLAGNVALTVGARGGVFIGGGIVPRIAPVFFASAFRERFEAKGRLRPYLQPIPTAVITDTLAALTGAAAVV
jgi:glucokinase